MNDGWATHVARMNKLRSQANWRGLRLVYNPPTHKWYLAPRDDRERHYQTGKGYHELPQPDYLGPYTPDEIEERLSKTPSLKRGLLPPNSDATSVRR